MKTQFTPGPWTRKSIPGHLFEISGSSGPVFRIRGGMMPSLEDARLLEQAPAMFAALERIADMLDREGNPIEMHIKELQGIARAALAKVKP